MEWYIMNSTGVRSLATGFGTRQPDGRYVLADECGESLSDLIDLLERDDPSTFLHRRHVLTENVVQRDLSQIISSGAPDVEELSLALKLLCILAKPVDLSSLHNAKIRDEVVRSAQAVHIQFLEIDFVTGLFHQLNEIISESGEYEMPDEGYASISAALTLVSYVLEAAETHPGLRTAVIGLLLHKGLSVLLIYSICCHRSRDMACSAAHILSLLFSRFEWTKQIERSEDPRVLGLQYITDKLKCLVVRLLQGPFVMLIKDLMRACHTQSAQKVDPDNLLNWSLAFFLPLLNEVPVPLTAVSDLLKSKVMGYLVYQAAKLSVPLFDERAPIDSCHRSSVELVFTAIESLLNLINHFKPRNLELSERQILSQFYRTLYSMSELRDLLLLHIRKWCPAQSRPFLYQLLLINHRLLSAIQSYIEVGAITDGQDIMLDHVSKFATHDVITNLSRVAESYGTNPVEVNEATFNLLSHIAVDCEQVSLLYHPELLQSLGKICDANFVKEEDRRLADYIIESFMHNLTVRPELCVNAFMDSMSTGDAPPTPQAVPGTPDSDWSSDEEAELVSAFSASNSTDDVVEKIAHRLRHKGERSIRRRLERMGPIVPVGENESKSASLKVLAANIEDGERKQLQWIHEALKGNAHVKTSKNGEWCAHAPIHVFAFKRAEDFPILPFTETQEKSLRSPNVMRIITAMDLAHNEAPGVPVIPTHWTASDVFRLAELLSSVDSAPFYETISPSASLSSLEDQAMTTDDCFDYKPSQPPISLSSGADSNSQLWMRYMQNNCRQSPHM